MLVSNLALQHVDKFGPFMLKGRKGFALIVHRYEKRLEQLSRPTSISQQVVRMTSFGADANHLHASASFYLLGTSVPHRILLIKLSQRQTVRHAGTLDGIDRC